MTAPDVRYVSNLQYAPEFVANAIERQQALKVRLIALFKWVAEQCKRIISRMKLADLARNAAKNIITSLPLLPATVATPITPASKYGNPGTMKALAEKGKTAATTKPRRKGEFKTPTYTDRPKLTDHYGQLMREAKAEI